MNDTPKNIAGLRAKFPDAVDVQLISAVREVFPAYLRGESSVSMLEVMMEDDKLNRYYQFDIGFERINTELARATTLIAHRHLRMKILEISAGTGGTTTTFLPAPNGSFLS
jgi:hypothetical protein